MVSPDSGSAVPRSDNRQACFSALLCAGGNCSSRNERQDGRNLHHHAHDDSHGGCGRAVVVAVAGHDGNEVRFGGSGARGSPRAARVRPSRGRFRRRPAIHRKTKTKREKKKKELGGFTRVQQDAACFVAVDVETASRSGFDGRRCLPVVVI
jgi:hypothetical protein